MYENINPISLDARMTIIKSIKSKESEGVTQLTIKVARITSRGDTKTN